MDLSAQCAGLELSLYHLAVPSQKMFFVAIGNDYREFGGFDIRSAKRSVLLGAETESLVVDVFEAIARTVVRFACRIWEPSHVYFYAEINALLSKRV